LTALKARHFTSGLRLGLHGLRLHGLGLHGLRLHKLGLGLGLHGLRLHKLGLRLGLHGLRLHKLRLGLGLHGLRLHKRLGLRLLGPTKLACRYHWRQGSWRGQILRCFLPGQLRGFSQFRPGLRPRQRLSE